MIYNNDKLIAAAFVKARKEIGGTVGKDAKGNFGSYATLAAITDATSAALANHGLAIIQEAALGADGVTIHTCLLHESGATMLFEPLTMPLTDRKPQAVGSAITYGRRYALAAVCGLAPEDDDGQAAQDSTRSAPQSQATRPQPAQKPANGTTTQPRAVDATTGEILDTNGDVIFDAETPPHQRLFGQGISAFGKKDWDGGARAWLISNWTAQVAKTEIRDSASELSDTEKDQLADYIAAKLTKLQDSWLKHKSAMLQAT